jgi:hypothetical protein
MRNSNIYNALRRGPFNAAEALRVRARYRSNEVDLLARTGSHFGPQRDLDRAADIDN